MPNGRTLIVLLLLGVSACSVQADSSVTKAESVSFDTLRKIASDLSCQPYASPAADLPQIMRELDYHAYRMINFSRDKAIWRQLNLPFQLEFFHRGYLYPNRVEMYLVENGQTVPVAFDPVLFRYRQGMPDGINSNVDMGFAGLRIVHKSNTHRTELVSFLGASYFRAVPFGGVYGASARGIAIDTAVAQTNEEFPDFRSFWVIRPQPDAQTLTIYALLDGPGITGAYRFAITPGRDIAIGVRTCLFPRKPIKAMGLAPLTSMFLYDENKDPGPARMNFRPEVHDSDGLLLATGSGQWIWRRLHNPRQSLFSTFGTDGKLKGFGLIQRDRQPKHYSDYGTCPQFRPSIWVEPVGDWPDGRVELLELPAEYEGMDNIVAQYVLSGSHDVDKELSLEYRLSFYSYPKQLHPLARAVRTLSHSLTDGDAAYTIDFAGEKFSSPADLNPVVTAIGGDVTDVRLLAAEGGIYRVNFAVTPKKDSRVVELRASLRRRTDLISEIWSDQWKP